MIVLMGWQFAAAEFLGTRDDRNAGPSIPRVLTPEMVEQAKRQADKAFLDGRACRDGYGRDRWFSDKTHPRPGSQTAISHNLVMDWVSIWKDNRRRSTVCRSARCLGPKGFFGRHSISRLI
jgi:hypothetical protein